MKLKKLVLAGVLATSMAVSSIAYAYNQEFTNDLHYKKGIISLNSNNYSDAIVELKKALNQYPHIIEVRNNLVDAYYRRGVYNFSKKKNYKKAANDFRAAIFLLRYYQEPTAVELEKVYIAESNLTNCLIKQGKGLDFKSRLKEAKKLRGQGLFTQAVVEFNEAAKDQTIRPQCLEYLGDLMVILDENEKAAGYYQNVVVIEPNNFDAHLKFAQVLEKLGDSDKAIQEYNLAMQGGISEDEALPALEKLAVLNLKKHPNNAISYLNLGAVFQKKQDYITALNYYQKALELDSTNPVIKLNIGSLYQAQGNYNKAINIYDEIIKVHPYDKLAHLYRAQAFKQSKQYTQAINGFQTVLKIDPKDNGTKAELLDTISNYLPKSQVIDYFGKVALQNPDDETVQFLFANELFKEKIYQKAIFQYKNVVNINHKNINAYINMAKAYQELLDFDSANNILDEGIAKNNGDKQLEAYKITIAQNKLVHKYEQAGEFYDKGNFIEALNIYETVEKPNKDTYINIAACYQGLKQYDKALVFYQKALKEDSKDSSILYYLGTVHYSQNNYENANVFYKKALALDPQNKEIEEAIKLTTMAYNNKLLQQGLKQYNTLDYKNALETLDKLLNLDKQNAYGFYYRGLVYDALNQQKKAVEDYIKAISFMQDLDIAYYALAVDYDVLKDTTKAKEAYQKFVQNSKEENEYTKYAKERIEQISAEEKDESATE